MAQPIPHFATTNYAFATRRSSEVIKQVFTWILNEANEAGYLDPDVVFVDGTHIKANANLKKHIKKEIPQTARHFEKQHMEDVNRGRIADGKKPFDDDDSKPPKYKVILSEHNSTDDYYHISISSHVVNAVHFCIPLRFN